MISGGGGLGDPLERDPNLVLMDLLNGYILEEQVKSVYGVVISDGIVNREATELIRKEIRVRRKHPHNCPKCGYVEPIPELISQLEGDRVIIEHIYKCPTCMDMSYINDVSILIYRVFG
ncbi:MAG: hypothetical protein ACO2O0_13285 [Desulfurococcales archaeon]